MKRRPDPDQARGGRARETMSSEQKRGDPGRDEPEPRSGAQKRRTGMSAWYKVNDEVCINLAEIKAVQGVETQRGPGIRVVWTGEAANTESEFAPVSEEERVRLIDFLANAEKTVLNVLSKMAEQAREAVKS